MICCCLFEFLRALYCNSVLQGKMSQTTVVLNDEQFLRPVVTKYKRFDRRRLIRRRRTENQMNLRKEKENREQITGKQRNEINI